MFPKTEIFSRADYFRMFNVRKNLITRGIKCDLLCERCSAEEESIIHVPFEYPTAFQVWELSTFPKNPGNFSLQSVFANMDYLLWRIVVHIDVA